MRKIIVESIVSGRPDTPATIASVIVEFSSEDNYLKFKDNLKRIENVNGFVVQRNIIEIE